MPKGARETDIGKVVVAWLQADGWDVYQELCEKSYARRVDVYAVRGTLTHAIECKTTFSLSVIEQANHWRWRAHFSSVAVPMAYNSRSRLFAEDLCRQLGIGVIQCNRWIPCRVVVAPALNRHARRMAVCESQRTFAQAGNADNSYWTPFQQTISNLRNIVPRGKPMLLKEAMEQIKHHYSSDKSAMCAIPAYLREGGIRGLKLEKIGRRLYIRKESPNGKDKRKTSRRKAKE